MNSAPPEPVFTALRDEGTLEKFRIPLEMVRVKNPNKNPVAEAIMEIEE